MLRGRWKSTKQSLHNCDRRRFLRSMLCMLVISTELCRDLPSEDPRLLALYFGGKIINAR